MENTQVLKIEVSERINVIDVFLTAKEHFIKVVRTFVDSFINIFVTNTYVGWQAIPVRGPDVSAKLYRISTTLF